MAWIKRSLAYLRSRMKRQKKSTPAERVSSQIEQIYRGKNTSKFILHGTVSENLEPIRKEGLRENRLGTYFIVPASELRALARKGGLVPVMRRLIYLLEDNVGYAFQKHLIISSRGRKYYQMPHARKYLIPFEKIGLVIGRHAEEAGKYDPISAHDIVETITLSSADVGRLNAKFPEAKGVIPSNALPRPKGAEVYPHNPYSYRVRRAIARILARKAIERLSKK